MPKPTTFWRTYCILPQILGRWYTKKVAVFEKVDNTEGTICYCREKPDVSEPTVFCSNDNCLVSEFHFSCILPSSVKREANIWYCPNCRKLEEFKPQKKKKGEQNKLSSDALLLKSICICKVKPSENKKLLYCNNAKCNNGKYFHLSCLNYKRLPNNSKTTWVCHWCKASMMKETSSNSKQKIQQKQQCDNQK